jgi:hypothetical protein
MDVRNQQTIEEALSQLPKTLNETYARILRQIHPTVVQAALRALQWLSVSARPLYIEELADASAVHTNAEQLNVQSHRLSPYNVFQMLRDFVAIEPRISEGEKTSAKTHRVILSHFSVREFLTGSFIASTDVQHFAVHIPEAHEYVAKACLTYLYRYNSHHLRHENFPLCQYAWYNWEYHIPPYVGSALELTRTKALQIFEAISASGSQIRGSALAQATPKGGAFEETIDKFMRILASLQLSDSQRLEDALKLPYFEPEFDLYETKKQSNEGPELYRPLLYRPLDSNKREIRVLSVLPCLDKAAPILCLLGHVSLNQRPRYKAVSYLWDRPENKDHMIVNGHCVQAMIRITLLLRHIRCSKEDSPAILWIDSLSINQHDVTEK